MFKPAEYTESEVLVGYLDRSSRPSAPPPTD
jgi:hypothetical protein